MKDRTSDLITKLAAEHRVGTVGLTGSFARGEVTPDADIDLIVTVPMKDAEPFAAALADAAYRMVHLHAIAALPWHHPYHLCIRWLNVGRLPQTFAPRGAVIRRVVRHNGAPQEMAVPVERIAHFVPVENPLPVAAPPGSRLVCTPPLGGFLL